jgi:hypothetical protein
MRARVPITLGLSAGLSLALSLTAGSAGVTILAVSGVVAGALAFGSWVLSTDARTERLERLIMALRGPIRQAHQDPPEEVKCLRRTRRP